MSGSNNSYKQILRSSSIVGGGHAANYLIGLIRVKVVASLIGPEGVGLTGLYASAIGFFAVVAGLGISSSAVREIVRAYSRDDGEEAARTIVTLRRLCWATGLLGWALTFLFREQISVAMTGSAAHAQDIALLGATILIGAVSGGQNSHLQGLRRLGDMARADVSSALIATTATIVIYWWLGMAGIVPAMILTSLVTLGATYWFSRKIQIVPVSVGWRATLAGFRPLVGLGLAFMWSGVLQTAVDAFTRALITHQYGISSAGIYQAAWALSGIFANFVLTAMGADYYPRLTSLIHDRPAARRTVNEQTEIGMLLALPGLMAAVAFAPLAIKLLYTREFLPAAELLPWMSLGVFGRVISWPLSFIQLALGASRWFAGMETIFTVLQAIMMYVLLKQFGVVGAAYTYVVLYALYIPTMLWLARRLIDFTWTGDVVRLIGVASLFVAAALLVHAATSDGVSLALGGMLTFASMLFSAHGLTSKLGHGHRLRKLMTPTPGARLRSLARSFTGARKGS